MSGLHYQISLFAGYLHRGVNNKTLANMGTGFDVARDGKAPGTTQFGKIVGEGERRVGCNDLTTANVFFTAQPTGIGNDHLDHFPVVGDTGNVKIKHLSSTVINHQIGW